MVSRLMPGGAKRWHGGMRGVRQRLGEGSCSYRFGEDGWRGEERVVMGDLEEKNEPM